jgi:hypothetical protein
MGWKQTQQKALAETMKRRERGSGDLEGDG